LSSVRCEIFFKDQLSATEKNAVRALTELDTAWQQERQRWQQTVAQQLKRSPPADELQTASQNHLEQRVKQLVNDNAELQAHVTGAPRNDRERELIEQSRRWKRK